MMDELMKERISYLECFQVCDSTFPIGTFNHSFGLENYIVENRVNNSSKFKEWLFAYYKTQYKFGEGLVTTLCYKALDEGDIDKLWEYDEILTISTVSEETRKGGIRIAKQMLSILILLHEDNEILKQYKEKIDEGILYGNPAIIFSIFAYHKGIKLYDAYFMYGYSIGSTMVQNAVRAIPLGQKDGQVVLHSIIELLGKLYNENELLDESYLGANSLGIEMAQIRHETQIARLFMS